MKKQTLFFVLFITVIVAPLVSQQHISVELDSPIYHILETAQIKNLCKPLPKVKPYTQKQIINALKEIAENPKTSKREQEICSSLLERYENKKSNKWYLEGRYRYETGQTNPTQNDKDPQPEKNTKEPLYSTVEIGGKWSSRFDFGAFNSGDEFKPSGVFSTQNWLDLYLQGDISHLFSYNLHMGVGISAINLNAHTPYSFTQSWDGYVFPFSDVSKFGSFETPAGVIRTNPELVLSLWEDKLKLSFSRIRRDWGIGSGNLMLSHSARPFVGIDFMLNPIDWFNLVMTTGVLEYYRTGHDLEAAKEMQNSYSASMVEFIAKEWAYFSLFSSVIWPKRYEPGYGHPGLLSFIYQNMIGDFDNMQMGVALGFNVPSYLNFYFSLFLDEANFLMKPFKHLDRNMYSWQLGGRFAIPKIPFTTISLQYTKIEPYMYTHPLTSVPWYSIKMDTSYLNHGEPIGSKLPPNSDELKISIKSSPLWYFTTDLSYSMIRHGLTADGSTYTDRLNYGDLNLLNSAKEGDLYWKDFLKDGVYEWIHVIALQGELDLRFVNVPLSIGASYKFAYRSLRTWDTDKKRYTYVGNISHNSQLENAQMQNLFSLWLKVY